MTADTLAFHAAAPEGGEGYVLLLERADGGGVRWREWSSEDYMAPAREGTSDAGEIASRVERWARAGWTLSESVHRITRWLRPR